MDCRITALLVMALLLAGCAPHKDVHIEWVISGGSGCNDAPELKFFVHQVRLLDSSGHWVPVDLASGRSGKPSNLGLLQPFATGCKRSPATLKGRAPDGDYRGLAFTIGVPGSSNHSDPLVAGAPLNDASMFWTWQQGHKFLSLEGHDGAPYVLHVGSTGCKSPSALRPPQQPCDRPNRAVVTLPDFEPQLHRVAIRPRVLIEKLRGKVCTGRFGLDPTCSSALLELGLDAQTGQCIDGCISQSIFGVAKK